MAAVRAVLSALSTSFAFAASSFAFNASTFAWANAASAWVLLSASATIAFAACFAASISAFSFATSALYAFFDSSVFPAKSASPNTAKSASACPNAVFCSGVTLSTNAAFAATNAAFFSFTSANASATRSGVAFWSSITAFAFLSSSVAASFAWVYAVRLSVVLPVGVSSPFKSSNAFLACVNASLFARSFSKAAASVNFALIAFTLSCALNASISLAFSPFSATDFAASFASVNSSLNSLNFLLYSSTLAGVFPSVTSFSNVAKSVANLSFCSWVAAVINAALALANAALASLTLASASFTCFGVGSLLWITFSAAAIASFANFTVSL